MRCEYCDNEVSNGLARCPNCGATIGATSLAASKVSIVAASKLHESPVAVEEAISGSRDRKSRLVYVLLGIFLGTLGIHNFYVGRSNRAVGQLLTTVLAGWLFLPLIAVLIWVLVDVCAITTDGDGNKFA